MERFVIMEMNNQPLVSVPVITYNSAKFVLETLESIKAQTYQNIELVISDDCSTDNTVQICRDWVEKNKSRFVRTHIIESHENTGISANLNRAEKACVGEWIKGIAGDDLLLPDCITHMMNYIAINPSVKFLFSRVKAFGPDEEVCKIYNDGVSIFDYSLFNKTSKEQWECFVYEDAHIPAATFMYSTNAMHLYGVINDERIPYTEDEPKWINLLKAGAKFDFIDEETVLYRVGHDEAMSSNSLAYSPIRFTSICKFYLYYKFEERYRMNPNKAIDDFISFIIPFYETAYYKETNNVYKSRIYRIKDIFLHSIQKFIKIIRR